MGILEIFNNKLGDDMEIKQTLIKIRLWLVNLEQLLVFSSKKLYSIMVRNTIEGIERYEFKLFINLEYLT